MGGKGRGGCGEEVRGHECRERVEDEAEGLRRRPRGRRAPAPAKLYRRSETERRRGCRQGRSRPGCGVAGVFGSVRKSPCHSP